MSSSELAAVKLIQFAWFLSLPFTGGFIRHCNRCAYGLTANRRAGPSMQTLGPLLQYTWCTKQRDTSYRGYFTYLHYLQNTRPYYRFADRDHITYILLLGLNIRYR